LTGLGSEDQQALWAEAADHLTLIAIQGQGFDVAQPSSREMAG